MIILITASGFTDREVPFNTVRIIIEKFTYGSDNDERVYREILYTTRLLQIYLVYYYTFWQPALLKQLMEREVRISSTESVKKLMQHEIVTSRAIN